MTPLLFLSISLLGQPQGDADHPTNDVYRRLVTEGVDLDGARVTLEPPLLRDGQAAEDQRRKLVEIAGSEKAVDELLRDSVTAPFVLKLRDQKTPGGVIRHAHLVFAIRANLDAIDPGKAAQDADNKAFEAANMKLATRILDANDLRTRNIVLPPQETGWFSHNSVDMLDRIQVQTTNRVEVSRSDRSLAVASETDRRFDAEGPHTNAWQALDRKGVVSGRPTPYSGSISYARCTRLASSPDTLVVESRLAVYEPNDWFQGAAILRSKFSLIAQDQIRRVRREILSRKKAPR